MKTKCKQLKESRTKAFTLLEMKDSKILYILHFIVMSSEVT